MSLNRHFDSIVIGAGIVGLTTALKLSEQGRNVLVLEAASSVGQGASGNLTGVLIPPSGRRAEKQLGIRARAGLSDYCAMMRAYSDSAQSLTEQVGFRTIEVIRLLERPPKKGLTKFQKELSDEELKKRIPFLRLSNNSGAQKSVYALSSEGAFLNTKAFLNFLVKQIEERGGRVLTHQRLLPLRPSFAHPKFHTITTDCNDTYFSESLIITTGIATNGLLRSFPEEQLPIEPVGGEIITVRVNHQLDSVVVSDRITFVPKTKTSLVITGVYRKGERIPRLSEASKNKLIEAVNEVFNFEKVVSNKDIIARWSGIRPRIVGALPTIKSLKRDPSIIVAAGHGSNAYTLAPSTACEVQRLLD